MKNQVYSGFDTSLVKRGEICVEFCDPQTGQQQFCRFRSIDRALKFFQQKEKEGLEVKAWEYVDGDYCKDYTTWMSTT